MLIYLFTSMCMVFSGLLMYVFKRKHLLSMLLSLEMIVVALYFMIYLYFSHLYHELFFTMIFLTMSVCEGALGLSILVMMIRSHSNDYILSFSSLW